MHAELQAIANLAAIDAERDRLAKEIRDLKAALEQAAQAEKESHDEQKRAYEGVAVAEAAEREANARLSEARKRESIAKRALETGAGDPDAAERQQLHSAELADTAETDVLRALDAQDRARLAVTEAERGVALASATRREIEARAPGQLAKLTEALAKADGERVPAVAALGRESIARYETIRKKIRVCVAPIVDSACSFCQRIVAAQHLSDLKRGASIEACRGCGRWLLPP